MQSVVSMQSMVAMQSVVATQNALRQVMRYRTVPRRTTAMLCTLLIAALPAIASAADATVILSQECEYVLLDSTRGQILIKLIDGDKPKSGDTLSGTLKQRDFSKLTVKRTGKVISTWVDIVDRSGTKALMRYSQYCN